ncbi:MAG: ATPase, partial [Clostridia bacterium]|nr:ATPase [Clostridia bacterium]
MKAMYYCGWDGGGSSTKVFLLPEEGAACQTQGFGPLNPNGSTPGAVRQTVADCVQWMANQAGGLKGCGGLVIGIAGVSNLYVAQLLENAVRECGYHGNLRLLGDQEIALAGAIDGPGAILIAGTGSICFGRDKAGHTFRAGGFGYLIDDAGSGYAIGRDILA